MWDRFHDHYVQEPMQKIVTDRLRPAGANDAYGVEQARASLHRAYAVLEPQIAAKPWMMGDAFTLADCAAAPALFYADKVEPMRGGFPALAAYLDRLEARPSFARVLEEKQPWWHMFPYANG
jgi:glutathione S-transferase